MFIRYLEERSYLIIRYQFVDFHLTPKQQMFNLEQGCRIAELLGKRRPQRYLVHLPLPVPTLSQSRAQDPVIYLLPYCHQGWEAYHHQHT